MKLFKTRSSQRKVKFCMIQRLDLFFDPLSRLSQLLGPKRFWFNFVIFAPKFAQWPRKRMSPSTTLKRWHCTLYFITLITLTTLMLFRFASRRISSSIHLPANSTKSSTMWEFCLTMTTFSRRELLGKTTIYFIN